jgi:hypothetical protein
METEIIAAIMERIASMKSANELFLAGGGAKSFEEYCRIVGEYSALQKVEGELKDLEQRYIES